MENVNNSAKSLDSAKLAAVLELGELAADMTRADTEHRTRNETAGATLWAMTVKVANDIGKDAFFVDYWPAAKKVMTSSPEMAEKYACSPNQKQKGKWNVPKYLSQTVSRIKSAMDHRLKLTNAKGELVPQSKLTAEIAEANKAKLAADRAKADPIYETRKTVADSIAMLSDHVRKGSHDKEILGQVTERVQALAKLVGYQAPTPAPAPRPVDGKKVLKRLKAERKAAKRAVTPPAADKQGGAGERKAA